MFQRLIISAAAVVLIGSNAHAVVVTISSNNVVSTVFDPSSLSYVRDTYNGTSIPSRETLTAVHGGNSSET